MAMFVKVRGTKVGVHGEGEFVVNVDNIKSLEIIGDTKVLYLLSDNYGITLKNSDFCKLYLYLNPEDFTDEDDEIKNECL